MNSNHSTSNDQRRPDWRENDRRKSRPWVADSNDRRSGRDRRVENEGASR
ncbi:MAG TPA: hypothetical protein VGB45_04720 [Abditibacterium sp.]|jgi:hypothetical protein